MVKKLKLNKKENFFVENYKKSWKYIKESRNFIYVTLVIFVFSIFAGVFVPAPPSLEKIILEFIENLLNRTLGLSHFGLISFIFFNNLESSFFGMILGIFIGIFPIIVSIMNGYLLGFVSFKSVESTGIFILWRLFPHGIFELPALIISLGLGLKLGTFVFKKNKMVSFKSYLTESLRTFIFVIVPLLIIAAIIEGTLIFLIK